MAAGEQGAPLFAGAAVESISAGASDAVDLVALREAAAGGPFAGAREPHGAGPGDLLGTGALPAERRGVHAAPGASVRPDARTVGPAAGPGRDRRGGDDAVRTPAGSAAAPAGDRQRAAGGRGNRPDPFSSSGGHGIADRARGSGAGDALALFCLRLVRGCLPDGAQPGKPARPGGACTARGGGNGIAGDSGAAAITRSSRVASLRRLRAVLVRLPDALTTDAADAPLAHVGGGRRKTQVITTEEDVSFNRTARRGYTTSA